MYRRPYELLTTDLFIISGFFSDVYYLTSRTIFCRRISRLSRNTAPKIDRVSSTCKSVNENTKGVLDVFLLIP